MYQIGVDIGGTNIKVGLVSETLELLQSCSVRFPHDGARSVAEQPRRLGLYAAERHILRIP